MRATKDGEFRSSVYTQRPPYADFDAPAKFQEMHMIRTTECDIQMRELGETVFLSREEAEKALQEMEGKKDGKT